MIESDKVTEVTTPGFIDQHIEFAFRELREAWFNAKLLSVPDTRGWESEEQEEVRLERNREVKARFDKQTESIVSGSGGVVSPWCVNDMIQLNCVKADID